MEPTAILALISAAIALIEKLSPVVTSLKQSKELTPEQEAELDARIANLRNLAHWQL